MRALVEKGNTVLVIEHNMDVVKVADHVIDLGPTGGAGGGHILFAGTPEELAQQNTPTARYLKEELERGVYSDEDVIDLSDSDDEEDYEDEPVDEEEPEEA